VDVCSIRDHGRTFQPFAINGSSRAINGKSKANTIPEDIVKRVDEMPGKEPEAEAKKD
jgi:hypothetical protein